MSPESDPLGVGHLLHHLLNPTIDQAKLICFAFHLFLYAHLIDAKAYKCHRHLLFRIRFLTHTHKVGLRIVYYITWLLANVL